MDPTGTSTRAISPDCVKLAPFPYPNVDVNTLYDEEHIVSFS